MQKKIETTPKLGFEVMELEEARLANVLGGTGGNGCGNSCCNSSRTCLVSV